MAGACGTGKVSSAFTKAIHDILSLCIVYLCYCVMKGLLNSQFMFHRAYIRRLGSPKQVRQIFAKACNAAKQIDWPEKIFEAWLLFEREHGTVSEYKEALTRSRAAMKTVEHLRAEVTTVNHAVEVRVTPW